MNLSFVFQKNFVEPLKKIKKYAHILITTPDSLYIILSTTNFREAFRRVNLNYPEAGIIPSKYISRYVGKISLNNKRQIQSNGKISKSFCEMARMPFLSKSWETKGGMPFKTAASYFILRGRRDDNKLPTNPNANSVCSSAIHCALLREANLFTK